MKGLRYTMYQYDTSDIYIRDRRTFDIFELHIFEIIEAHKLRYLCDLYCDIHLLDLLLSKD